MQPITHALLLLALLLPAGAAAQEPEPAAAQNTEPAGRAEQPDAAAQRIQSLEQRVGDLEARLEEAEMQRLIQEAEAEARAPAAETGTDERQFLSGALALQALNPEISVSANFVPQLIIDGDRFYASAEDRSGVLLAEFGMQIQHVLDPYSLFKAALDYVPGDGFDVEELYITWFGLGGVKLTLGRFRNSFGVVNRWHGHDLDQVDYPLAIRAVLGEDGVSGDGLSLKWLMPPLIAHANELTVEINNGANPVLFSGEWFSVASVMAHLKNYYDLSESVYLELGLSGMGGFNNRRGVLDAGSGELADEDWRHTLVAGADLTLQWSPPQQARYRSFTWRSEAYYVTRQLPAAGGGRRDKVSWGAYSYLDYQVAPSWFIGARYDRALPTLRDGGGQTWGVSAYATFWQSEFVYLRLQVSHADNVLTPSFDEPTGRRDDHRILLQVNWAAGPHKHEKY